MEKKKKCFTKLIYFAYFYEYIRKMLNMKKKKKKKKKKEKEKERDIGT